MKRNAYGRVAGVAASTLMLVVALPVAADVSWWAVPAMSEEQRLPDTVPTDGEKGGVVRIVAAKGEYEPGSFVVRSTEDLGKVKLEVSDLKQVKSKGEGEERDTGVVFPKENIDLKVIKVWYQNKNGWFTYFADTGFKLCPELLLNDEDLIRVDTEKVANYARLTEKDGRRHEFWLNPPRLLDRRYFDHFTESSAFPSMRPGFADEKTIQNVYHKKDVSKQYMLTAHVTSGVPAGVYRGTVTFRPAGKENFAPVAVPVELKVHAIDNKVDSKILKCFFLHIFNLNVICFNKIFHFRKPRYFESRHHHTTGWMEKVITIPISIHAWTINDSGFDINVIICAARQDIINDCPFSTCTQCYGYKMYIPIFIKACNTTQCIQ